ncbi:hypothetical protein WD019_02980 [Fictibacillus sp. Mic-4]|uniref:hypothetical protein n=1 Tax=Fictibacillus sp. Mic-4 TaxID=3132826 RepID=UPI003CE93BCE
MAGLIMDVYVCDCCDQCFAVEDAEEPKFCPVCESEIFEFSHSGELEMKEE